MFLEAINWGIAPGEFWDMTLGEWWAIYDMHESRAPYGATKMTRDEIDDLLEWTLNDGTSPA